MKEIISKADAIASGKRTYYTGAPCRKGHDSERLINGNCAQCNREWQKNNRAMTNVSRASNKIKRSFYSAELTVTEWNKIDALGGAAWIRLMIKTAEASKVLSKRNQSMFFRNPTNGDHNA